MNEASLRTISFHVPRTSDVCAATPQHSGASLTRKLDRIRKKLKQCNAVLIAHYYVDEQIQRLAEETGGIVAESLEMARFGKQSDADILVVAGVRFMGETAKILSPEKCVLMPTLDSTCSLDLSCPAEAFKAFCEQHPERTSVVYANTSAATKAVADWVVTSSIAVEVIASLMDEGSENLMGARQISWRVFTQCYRCGYDQLAR